VTTELTTVNILVYTFYSSAQPFLISLIINYEHRFVTTYVILEPLGFSHAILICTTSEPYPFLAHKIYSRRHTHHKLVTKTVTINLHKKFDANSSQLLAPKMAVNIVDAAAASSGSYINDLFSVKSINLLISTWYQFLLCVSPA